MPSFGFLVWLDVVPAASNRIRLNQTNAIFLIGRQCTRNQSSAVLSSPTAVKLKVLPSQAEMSEMGTYRQPIFRFLSCSPSSVNGRFWNEAHAQVEFPGRSHVDAEFVFVASDRGSSVHS